VGHCAQAPTEYGFVVVYDAARDERRQALSVIAAGRATDALRAALRTLPPTDPAVREAIVARYQQITADPRRLDADCALRAALLSGLRTCTQAADLALLEDAARTYEYGYKDEVAANLRAAALLAMSEVDDRVAAFHAVRLLPDAADGTGEPGLTAARLLAALGQPLPLYAHLLGGHARGEGAAECFRGLAGVPDSVLLDLTEQWAGSRDEVALLGLLDALLDGLPDRGEPERFEAALLGFVRESPHLDLVRYLATTIVARHQETLIEALRAGPWPAPVRRAIVDEALALLADT